MVGWLIGIWVGSRLVGTEVDPLVGCIVFRFFLLLNLLGW